MIPMRRWATVARSRSWLIFAAVAFALPTLVLGRSTGINFAILLIASHPTRGVDVGAQAAIWEHIKAARRKGLAVLLISADLDELIGLSDTIEVILRGRLVAEFDPLTVTPQQLGSAMTGGDEEGAS